MENNYFETLNNINVNDKTEKKNGLTYLSWAWAWGEIKKLYPNANYTIYENKDGWNYFTDGKTGWVKTGVIVNDIEHIEYLPIMDFRNKSIPADNITSFDVNKAIQRSLTKACARHGLGLYIYAGEDLPEAEDEKETPAQKAAATKALNKEKEQALKDKFPAVLDFVKGLTKEQAKQGTPEYTRVEKFITMLSSFKLDELAIELSTILQTKENDNIPF